MPTLAEVHALESNDTSMAERLFVVESLDEPSPPPPEGMWLSIFHRVAGYGRWRWGCSPPLGVPLGEFREPGVVASLSTIAVGMGKFTQGLNFADQVIVDGLD